MRRRVKHLLVKLVNKRNESSTLSTQPCQDPAVECKSVGEDFLELPNE